MRFGSLSSIWTAWLLSIPLAHASISAALYALRAGQIATGSLGSPLQSHPVARDATECRNFAAIRFVYEVTDPLKFHRSVCVYRTKRLYHKHAETATHPEPPEYCPSTSQRLMWSVVSREKCLTKCASSALRWPCVYKLRRGMLKRTHFILVLLWL